jgi:hypothetical protein
VSFGTHFFQDLVEAAIRYLPLFPGDPDVVFNTRFLHGAPNVLRELLPEYTQLAPALRVIDVPRATGGLILRVLMNADAEEALGMFATPSDGAIAVRSPAAVSAGALPVVSAGAPEEHWRWRLAMAERIAAELDAARFGVKALYVFGSTKNATAGPSSDIDLLVHVDATPEQRRGLDMWLEGWSLCLAEQNYLRTGRRTHGLLDVHVVTDADIQRQSSYAVKIGAVTDPARPLPLGRPERGQG